LKRNYKGKSISCSWWMQEIEKEIEKEKRRRLEGKDYRRHLGVSKS